MVLQILFLGSIGVLLSTLLEDSEGEDSHDGEDLELQLEVSVEDVENDLLERSSPFGELVKENIVPDAEISPKDDTIFQRQQTIEGLLETDVSNNPNNEYLPTEGLEVVTFNLKSIDEIDGTPPLDDFNSNTKTPILRIDEFDSIQINLNPEDGHVEALRADYYERFGSDDVDNSEGFHTGLNFYFVPPGEAFPDDYIWSEDSANLYNRESYISDSSDFGGIRLIFRIDTGFLVNASSLEEQSDFSDANFMRAQNVIVGTGDTTHE